MFIFQFRRFIVPLPGAAHRLRKDVDLDSFLDSVLLHHSRRTHEHTGLDVGHRRRRDRDKQRRVAHLQLPFGAVAVLDGGDRTVDLFDGGAQPHVLLRQRRSCGANQGEAGDGERTLVHVLYFIRPGTAFVLSLPQMLVEERGDLLEGFLGLRRGIVAVIMRV
jgi:hypothetical protein